MRHLIMLLAMALTACAMNPEEIALENRKLAVMQTIAAQPTIKCTHGCEYTDPNGLAASGNNTTSTTTTTEIVPEVTP